MDDGVSIAATLYLPDGPAPAGGWPAIVFLHGISQSRQVTNAIAEGYGFVGQSYAVLTFDARGHGESGGLVGIDGPREVADTRAVHAWLAARPDVADAKIGAWGISYGGGAVSQLARCRSAVGGGRHGGDLDRPLLRPHAARTREVRPRLRPRGHDPRSEARPRVERAPGGGFRRQRGCGAPLGAGTLEPRAARLRDDAGLHGPGPQGLPLRDRAGVARVRAAARAEGALCRAPRTRSVDVPRSRHRRAHDPDARLVRLPPPGHRLQPGYCQRLHCSRELRRARCAERVAAAGVADNRRLPGRDDLRSKRKGRPQGPEAAQGNRGVRLADGADLRRRERWLVSVGRRAHRTDTARERDRGELGRCPHEGRRTQGHDSPDQPGDIPSSRLTPDADAGVVIDRTVEREPPLPRSRDARDCASRAWATRSSSSRGFEHRSRSDPPHRRSSARGTRTHSRGCRSSSRRRSRPYAVECPARRNGPTHGRGRGVRKRGCWRTGVLRLRQREGWRPRAEDLLPVLRRRLQPRPVGSADEKARRGRRRVRGVRKRRDREQPRDPRLPERTARPAALRRRRLAADREELRQVPVDHGLPHELPRRGRRVREDARRHAAEGEDRRALREHRARARTCSPG